MGFAEWVQARRRSWHPVPATRAGLMPWFVLLGIVIVLGLGQLWNDLRGSFQHPPSIASDATLSLALCLLCLHQLALRTRFQLTARILLLATFALLAVWFFLHEGRR